MGQPRKDSDDKRVNYDNTRVSKFDKDTKNGSKRGRNNRRGKANRSEDKRQQPRYVDGTNDVSWYANNPELLRAASSIPFSVVNGQLLPTNPTQDQRSIPNTMSLMWNPTVSGMGNDAITQAANSMYSFVVHANSRNYKYGPADLMNLVLAGASFFSMLALGIRTYGIMRTYDQRNKFLPDDWIAMSGFQYSDLKLNLSQMWFDLNQLVAMSQQIWIPNTMPVITRWFWLNSNIYMDANSAKAQYYMFVPQTYFVYNETRDTQGGCLYYNQWFSATSPTTSTVQKTWADYMEVMQLMLNALINSEDRGIIFGDILNAYGADKIYSISPISVDYTVTPVYNPEVLTQIENAVVWCNDPTAASPFNTMSATAMYGGVFQDQVNLRLYSKVYWVSEAVLTTKPSTTSPLDNFILNMNLPKTPILNFHQPTLPTPEQVMVATRLMATGVRSGAAESIEGTTPKAGIWMAPAVCGTEFLSRVYVSYFQTEAAGRPQIKIDQLKLGKYVGYSVISAMGGDPYKALKNISTYQAFDWAPIWYMGQQSSEFTATEVQDMKTSYQVLKSAGPNQIFCEYDNWTTLDLDILSKMHTAAIYSEFGVPVSM